NRPDVLLLVGQRLGEDHDVGPLWRPTEPDAELYCHLALGIAVFAHKRLLDLLAHVLLRRVAAEVSVDEVEELALRDDYRGYFVCVGHETTYEVAVSCTSSLPRAK